GVGVEQVVGIVALIERALLSELERRVALLHRCLAVFAAELRPCSKAVGWCRRLVQIHEALATTTRTMRILEGEGLRGGHSTRKKRGSDERPRCRTEFHGGPDGHYVSRNLSKIGIRTAQYGWLAAKCYSTIKTNLFTNPTPFIISTLI